MGDSYQNGRTRTRHMRPGKLDWRRVRPEEEIRKDLARQIEAILKRQQERWSCP